LTRTKQHRKAAGTGKKRGGYYSGGEGRTEKEKKQKQKENPKMPGIRFEEGAFFWNSFPR